MSLLCGPASFSPFGDKHALDDLLFAPDADLLPAYCAVLVKARLAPECNANARLLVEYFHVHGRLADLMRRAAEREIETTNAETQVFRGNTAFTRIYNEYTHLYLFPYLREATKDTLAALTDEADPLAADDVESPAAPRHAEAIERLNALVAAFFRKLHGSLALLPAHFHHLYRFVCTALRRGPNANPQHTFNLLFFIRFVFPVFHAPRQVLDTAHQPSPRVLARLTLFSKTCQAVLNGASSPHLAADVAALVTQTAAALFAALTAPRTDFMTRRSGLDFSQQPAAHAKLAQLLRDSLDELCAAMPRDADRLRTALGRGADDASVVAEMQHSLQFCCRMFSDRLDAVEFEIRDINEEIRKARARLDAIRKAVRAEDDKTARLEEEIARLAGSDAPLSPHIVTSDQRSEASFPPSLAEDNSLRVSPRHHA